MALVLISRNGIGMGHLSRSIAIGSVLQLMKEHPILFAEGGHSRAIPHSLPTLRFSNTVLSATRRKQRLERQVSTCALLSTPSIVIEDTYSLELNLCDEIIRVMILRCLEFSVLKSLKDFLEREYDCILIADDPNSPTWPYGCKATRTLRTWRQWHFIGPVYRKSSAAQITRIKKRYAWGNDRRICVFSLGGGGEHDGADDATEFLGKATLVAQQLLSMDSNAQMVFVKGPLFRGTTKIPSIFRVVEQERFMPALLAVAEVAVIRPGFNSIWECIAGETPIYPILGTSFQEPMKARLAKLRASGLIVDELKSIWRNSDELSRIANTCRDITRKYSGCISSDAVQYVLSLARYRTQSIKRRSTKLRVLLMGRLIGSVGFRYTKGLANYLTQEGFEVSGFIETHRLHTSRLQRNQVCEVRSYNKMSGADFQEFDQFITEFDPEVIVVLNTDNQDINLLDSPQLLFRPVIKMNSMTNDEGLLNDSAAFISSRRKARGSRTNGRSQTRRQDGVSQSLNQQSLCQTLQSIDLYQKPARLSGYFKSFRNKQLVIRIDDVIDLSFGLLRILKLARAFRFHVSLEVIPYLNKLIDTDLDEFDPEYELIEISQHGYCHLPRVVSNMSQSEFSMTRDIPTARELKDLCSGKTILETAFPRRFRFGFSPPFDAVPNWLAQGWNKLNGRFVSVIHRRPHGAQIPTIRMPVDIRNWDTHSDRTIGAIWADIATWVSRLGYAGLVIHPQHFQTQFALNWLERLFSQLSRVGFETIRQSDMAIQLFRISTSPFRAYHSFNNSSRDANE